MTPQEMHIEVDQALQRVGSYVYDNFEPTEIDLHLTKMQLRYIDDKFRRDTTSEGFQVEQGDLDDIQYLIERDKVLPALLDTTNNKVYCILPSDYLYLINDRVKINDNCRVNLNSYSNYTNENIVSLKFIDTNEFAAPYYDSVILTVGGITLFDSTAIAGFPGVPDIIEKHLIINYILDYVRQGIRENKYAGVTGIYWEHYRKEYKANTFFVVTDNTLVGQTGILSVDAVNIQGTVAVVTGLQISSLTPTREVDNRLTKSQFLHATLRNNVYTATNRRNPVSNLTKDSLHVYYDEKYIPTSIIIDYIRKPRQISLSLNTSCELSSSTHPKIIDLTVEYIKNTIEQQSWQTKVQDNQLRSE